MRRPAALLAAAVAALALAGCGATGEPSADRFQGAERDVAQVVDDLASASRSADGEEICTRIVSAEFAEELGAGSPCDEEVGRAVTDANDHDLEVGDVTVTGNTARAVIRQPGGSQTTFEFERGSAGWRITSFTAGS